MTTGRPTPRSYAYDVLAAALELKVAVDVGDDDTAGRAYAELHTALDALFCERVASALREPQGAAQSARTSWKKEGST